MFRVVGAEPPHSPEGCSCPLPPFLCFPRSMAIAWPQWTRIGATFSQQSEPFGGSARGLSQPKLGQENEDGASVPAETPGVIMILVSYFCGLPGVPRKGRKHWYDIGKVSPLKSQFAKTMWRHSLLMPPGKKARWWHVYLQVQMCWERAKGITVPC